LSVASLTFVITDRVVEVKTIDDLGVAESDDKEWDYGQNDKQAINVDNYPIEVYNVRTL